MDEYTRAIIDEAIAQADASDAFTARVLQRSADRNLVFKVSENARVPSEAPPASGLSEDEMEGIGIALGEIRKQMRDHTDAAEGRLHAELFALRDEVKALRAQIESKNVVPIGKKDVA